MRAVGAGARSEVGAPSISSAAPLSCTDRSERLDPIDQRALVAGGEPHQHGRDVGRAKHGGELIARWQPGRRTALSPGRAGLRTGCCWRGDMAHRLSPHSGGIGSDKSKPRGRAPAKSSQPLTASPTNRNRRERAGDFRRPYARGRLSTGRAPRGRSSARDGRRRAGRPPRFRSCRSRPSAVRACRARP